MALSASAITRTGAARLVPVAAHPPGTPPDWAFPVAWGTLYLLMAVAAWMVWRHAGVARRGHYAALRLWGWQLLFNALWTPAFFGLRSPGLALVVILALLVLVALTLRAFAAGGARGRAAAGALPRLGRLRRLAHRRGLVAERGLISRNASRGASFLKKRSKKLLVPGHRTCEAVGAKSGTVFLLLFLRKKKAPSSRLEVPEATC